MVKYEDEERVGCGSGDLGDAEVYSPGEEDLAMRMAYELYITSTFHEEKMWNRLLVIPVEDIGFGDTQAPVLVKTMYDLHKEYPYMDGDRPIFFLLLSGICAGARRRDLPIILRILL